MIYNLIRDMCMNGLIACDVIIGIYVSVRNLRGILVEWHCRKIMQGKSTRLSQGEDVESVINYQRCHSPEVRDASEARAGSELFPCSLRISEQDALVVVERQLCAHGGFPRCCIPVD